MGDSVQVAPLAREQGAPKRLVQERPRSSSPWLPWWQLGTLLALLTWLYGPTLVRLARQWFTDQNFSHGIFVPAFAFFVVWQKRKEINEIVAAPSWTGTPILVSGLLMLVLGVLGAELFFSRSSLLLVIAGLVILFWGWLTFRAILFPWACLILMIPIPAIILQKVTFPLQIFASKVAAAMLRLVGVPVYREGNVINLPAMPLEVVQACSGIRSLLSLITLAIIYGYLLEQRKSMRIFLAVLAVPIAIFANSLRIVGTGLLVQYWDPDKAEGFFHTFQGWLIFVLSLAMLFALHRLANRFWPVSGDPVPATRNNAGGNTGESRGPIPHSLKIVTVRFAVAAVFMCVTALMLQARSSKEVFPPRQSLNAFPSSLGSWTARDIPIDQQTLDILGSGEFLLRDYASSSEQAPPVNLFIAYFPSQRMGDTIHSPSHCLPGAGWVPTQKALVPISVPGGNSFLANRFVISKAGDRQLAMYWFQAHDREVANEYWAKYYLVADSIRMNRSDGALVRLMTPMLRGESADAAQARVMKLGSQIIPLLDTYIPR